MTQPRPNIFPAPANTGKRMLALAIDILILILLLWLVVSLWGQRHEIAKTIDTETYTETNTRSWYTLHGWSGAAWPAFWFLAMALPEGFTGQTPGKKLLRLKVIRQNGGPTNIGRSFIRQLFSLIELCTPVLIITVILINTNARKARLGDLLAGTYVIDKE